ncbi:hypothetical protein HK405_013282 [Cladochytrium tenue]|nr:hypothetical protein HK405_013282 [Cladochytrium tenue]
MADVEPRVTSAAVYAALLKTLEKKNSTQLPDFGGPVSVPVLVGAALLVDPSLPLASRRAIFRKLRQYAADGQAARKRKLTDDNNETVGAPAPSLDPSWLQDVLALLQVDPLAIYIAAGLEPALSLEARRPDLLADVIDRLLLINGTSDAVYTIRTWPRLQTRWLPVAVACVEAGDVQSATTVVDAVGKNAMSELCLKLDSGCRTAIGDMEAAMTRGEWDEPSYLRLRAYAKHGSRMAVNYKLDTSPLIHIVCGSFILSAFWLTSEVHRLATSGNAENEPMFELFDDIRDAVSEPLRPFFMKVVYWKLASELTTRRYAAMIADRFGLVGMPEPHLDLPDPQNITDAQPSAAGASSPMTTPPLYTPSVDPVFVGTSESFADLIRTVSAPNVTVAALDCEWKPDFLRVGGGADDDSLPASVLQIALQSGDGSVSAYVVGLSERSPNEVLSLLSPLFDNKKVLKLGFGFSQDMKRLRQNCPKLKGRPLVHFRDLSNDKLEPGAPRSGRGGPSLAAVVEKRLGRRLDKSHRISNWDRRPLSPEQLKYAVI